jgi:hypothetical protein
MKKLLYTFFFGYAALKWRRLIRTLIVLATIVWLTGIFVERPTPTFGIILNSIGLNIAFYILIGLISWLIKPFIVKEDK